jgi:tungstate transport system substrate-binding protein
MGVLVFAPGHLPHFGALMESETFNRGRGVLFAAPARREVPFSQVIIMRLARFACALVALVACVVSSAGVVCAAPQDAKVLRLATTTSTQDTGLLSAILPDFERQFGCRVDVVAVGTGQALELGRRGDADVLLVHARQQEEQFIKDGFAARRDEVMYNDFVIVGPAADPAGIRARTRAVDALQAIAAASAIYASRGDKSGTHTKELALFKAAGITPTPATQPWYQSVGQGMGETLAFANERGAYTLSDRASWLSMSQRMTRLRVLFGGDTIATNPDQSLRNDYGVIAVKPGAVPTAGAQLAVSFVAWITSVPVQQRIGTFGHEKFGQPLFYPDSAAYRASRAPKPPQ